MSDIPKINGQTDGARRSAAIAIARVICILGVVYVHAWTGLNGEALQAKRSRRCAAAGRIICAGC